MTFISLEEHRAICIGFQLDIEEAIARAEAINKELIIALQMIRLTVEDEAYKVKVGQQPCKHTAALNEIHEIADEYLTKYESKSNGKA